MFTRRLLLISIANLVFLVGAVSFMAHATMPQASQAKIERWILLSASNDHEAMTYFYLPIVARGGTPACGEITSDTTWNIAGNPYQITCDVTVPAGVTLTIEAGVVVQVDPFYNSLNVYGNLQAMGTAYAPIRIKPTIPYNWERLAFMPGSSGVLEHVSLEDGGYSEGGLYIASDDVQILNSFILGSEHTGIIIQDASPLISDTQILSNTGGGLYNDSGNPTIQNCLFNSNWDYDTGGGIYNGSGSPTIQNNTFEGNSAGTGASPGNGGGLYNDSGSPIIRDNIFDSNYAGWGLSYGSGGGLYTNSGSPVILGNTFTGNAAKDDISSEFWGYGGGIFIGGGSPTIQDNTLGSNKGAHAGGGLYNSSGTAIIQSNIFSGNSARSGGGLFIWTGHPVIQSNIITGNMATLQGGGLCSDSGSPTIQNNTFTSNSAPSGGGLYLYQGNIIVRSNIIISNTASAGGGIYMDYIAHTLLVYNDVWNNQGGDYSGVTPGAHDISVNPKLVDHANGDFHLAPDSPCIDAGDPLHYAFMDVDGDHRPMGMAVDIGADEYLSLWVAKTSMQEESSSGEPITYTLVIFNPETFSLTNVWLIDDLPVETQFTHYQADGLTCSHDGSTWGGQVSCTLVNGSLAPGESQALTINAIITDSLPTSKYITNTVTASASGSGKTFSAYGWTHTWVAYCGVQLNETPMENDIQTAINASTQSTDVVKVSGYCRVHDLSLVKNLILQGGWSQDFSERDRYAYPTTLDAQEMGTVIYVGFANPTVEDFTITGGSAVSGGGLSIGGGSPTIRNNIFTGNLAYGEYAFGGGLYTSGGDPLIMNNTFIGNRSEGNGGALFSYSGNPIIQNNLIYSNPAGGVQLLSGNAYVLNNTISNNSGVGLMIWNENPVILNNIIVNNTAGISNGGNPSVDYNDVWNNLGGDYLSVELGLHDISANPLLVDPANGDFHLAPGSPCIDAGDPDNYAWIDFEGDIRPLGLAPDIGADEFNAAAYTPGNGEPIRR